MEGKHPENFSLNKPQGEESTPDWKLYEHGSIIIWERNSESKILMKNVDVFKLIFRFTLLLTLRYIQPTKCVEDSKVSVFCMIRGRSSSADRGAAPMRHMGRTAIANFVADLAV